MGETLGQRIFRAVVSTVVALLGSGAILYYGYFNVPLVNQYWLIPAIVVITYLLYKDIRIIKGKE